MKKEAKFWGKLKDKKVQCGLCSQSCIISEGDRGFCGVRENIDGALYSLIYGSCSSVAVDPIEKKPLYHFRPGSSALSLGTVGCNFRCEHCQNASISRGSPDSSHLRDISPERIVEIAEKRNCDGIAWTYNEPTIWYEYSFDSAKLASKKGLYNVYVSNGYIQEEPLREFSPFLDGMNIDVKAFHDDFYKKVCKARLQPVLDTCELAKELGIHLEVTYLVIPSYNDSDEEIEGFCDWVVDELGEDTPVHFSRFYPAHRMRDVDMTPMDTMVNAYNKAKDAGVLYVYLGNVPDGRYGGTVCPNCGNVCVERSGFSVDLKDVEDGKCGECGASLSIVV